MYLFFSNCRITPALTVPLYLDATARAPTLPLPRHLRDVLQVNNQKVAKMAKKTPLIN